MLAARVGKVGAQGRRGWALISSPLVFRGPGPALAPAPLAAKCLPGLPCPAFPLKQEQKEGRLGCFPPSQINVPLFCLASHIVYPTACGKLSIHTARSLWPTACPRKKSPSHIVLGLLLGRISLLNACSRDECKPCLTHRVTWFFFINFVGFIFFFPVLDHTQRCSLLRPPQGYLILRADQRA